MSKPLTTKQLMDLVEDNKDIVHSPTRNANDVHRFITALGIKEGKHCVKNGMLYQVYCLWSSRPYSRKSFFIRFAKYYPPQSEKWKHYKLNYRAVELMNMVDDGKVKF